MAIKVVILDIGNVLIRAYHRITIETLVQHHQVPPEQAENFFKNSAYADFARGKVSGMDFYHFQVVDNLRRDLSLLQVVCAHDAHMYDISHGMVDLVRQIKVPLVFATDTNVWQTRRERELLDIGMFFPVKVFRSNELRALKTDPGCMWSIALDIRRIRGYHCEEILFIDDSADNLRPAAELGIQTYQYGMAADDVQSCAEMLAAHDLLK